MHIDQGDLISGTAIPYEQICTLRPPKLADIRAGTGIGFSMYYQYIQLLSLEQEETFAAMGLTDMWEAFSESERQQYPLFALLTGIPSLRERLQQVLSFFLCEDVVYTPERKGFLLFRPTDPEAKLTDRTCVGAITADNYEQIREGILQINGLSAGAPAKPVFRNQKAREIYEQMQRYKRRAAKPKTADSSMSLPNIIGAVAARHPGYTLLNIWELTICQLYDQFARLNRYHQIDVSAQRWAAWGKDPFDFALWYKDIHT